MQRLDVDAVLARSLPKALVNRDAAPPNLENRREEISAEETIILRNFATEMDITWPDILQDDGIKAFVFKDDAGGMEPHLQRTNGVRLVVNRVDADRARKILEPLLKV